ncbi:hypothetical protein [Leucobacter sp. Psy1]|nr:hypothetical protein [Leucobacter sp. Psy1]
MSWTETIIVCQPHPTPGRSGLDVRGEDIAFLDVQHGGTSGPAVFS